jgi:hypothetical protein
MQQKLGHHLWFAFLLLICGWHRRHKACHNQNNYGSNVFGPTIVDAAKRCREDRCNPDCVCTLPDDENATCADLYGNWGWIPPEDSEVQVWKKMDPEVRPNDSICLIEEI